MRQLFEVKEHFLNFKAGTEIIVEELEHKREGREIIIEENAPENQVHKATVGSLAYLTIALKEGRIKKK